MVRLVGVCFLMGACGGGASGSSTPRADVPSAPAPAQPPSAEPAAPPPSAAKPHSQRPLPIHSTCSRVVTVVFGDDPKAEAGGRRTINENGSIDGPRDSEGKQTVSLLDEQGEVAATVHVTRGMKAVEIGRSCRTLDAR